MCAQFLLRISSSGLSGHYGIKSEGDQLLDLRLLPYQPGIVVTHGMKFQKMQFSLVPSWSREARVKFATHNARIESVLEKPTWKEPFLSRRCLVPMTEFVESIPERGSMVKFSREDGELLTAAGIWDSWADPVTGNILNSFAILTSEPPAFILDAGHDRCPIFLKPEAFADWLDPRNQDADMLFRILQEGREEPAFKTAIDRPLKPKKASRRDE